jgi:hypothetical protein
MEPAILFSGLLASYAFAFYVPRIVLHALAGKQRRPCDGDHQFQFRTIHRGDAIIAGAMALLIAQELGIMLNANLTRPSTDGIIWRSAPDTIDIAFFIYCAVKGAIIAALSVACSVDEIEARSRLAAVTCDSRLTSSLSV